MNIGQRHCLCWLCGWRVCPKLKLNYLSIYSPAPTPSNPHYRIIYPMKREFIRNATKTYGEHSSSKKSYTPKSFTSSFLKPTEVVEACSPRHGLRLREAGLPHSGDDGGEDKGDHQAPQHTQVDRAQEGQVHGLHRVTLASPCSN